MILSPRSLQRTPFGYDPRVDATVVGWFDSIYPNGKVITAGSPDKVTSLTNLISGVAATEAAADAPTASSIFGLPAVEGAAAKRILTTEAALLAPFNGATPTWSVMIGCVPPDDEIAGFVGLADAALGGTDSIYLGHTFTSGGRWFMTGLNESGVSASLSASSDYTDDVPHVVTYTLSAGASGTIRDGLTTVASAAVALAPFSMTRFSIIGRPDNSPDSGSSGYLFSVLVFNVDLNLAANSEKLQRAVAWMNRRIGAQVR